MPNPRGLGIKLMPVPIRALGLGLRTTAPLSRVYLHYALCLILGVRRRVTPLNFLRIWLS